MYDFNINKPQHVYFIGIGGISMSGLAELLLHRGFKVTGSDNKRSALTDNLVSLGATIFYDQTVSHIPDDTDMAVYTAAIRPGNPDLDDATSRGIPTLTRAELLGMVMKDYSYPIAISGTHGKTTTTSMISEILMAADLDPTLSIGGILPSIGGNFRIGEGEHFVTEACEYTNSFLSFFPKIGIILNIDSDHLDFFKDLDDIRNSFHEFAKLIPEDGLLIINEEIPRFKEFVSDLKCKVITFSHSESSDYYAENISLNNNACATFTVKHHQEEGKKSDFVLGVPGVHNVYNSLAAIALADYLGISRDVTASSLEAFKGSERRFQFKGNMQCADGDGEFAVYDDYAHHPTEIQATMETALTLETNDIWVIFQPHTYTRTKALMEDFARVLSMADHVILTDIYAAREKDNLGISSDTLAERIRSYGCECIHISDFDEIRKYVSENCTKDDLLITMGAGDVVNIGEELLKKT